MRGLVPRIHVFIRDPRKQDVDGRHKAGHDRIFSISNTDLAVTVAADGTGDLEQVAVPDAAAMAAPMAGGLLDDAKALHAANLSRALLTGSLLPGSRTRD